MMKGDFSVGPPSSMGRLDLRMNYASRSYLPLFVIWKKVPFTFLTSGSSRFSGFLPIRRGPKSKTFSLTTKVFERKLSGSVGGLVFFYVRYKFRGF